MLRVAFISDTHGQHDQIVVPKCDVLVHCGDGTNRGGFAEIASLNKWFGEVRSQQPSIRILFVPGNHDKLFSTDPNMAKMLMSNADVLIDESIYIENVKFYGSPWTPEFKLWDFMLFTEGQSRKVWSRIESDVDVLITHGPP